MIDKKIDHAYKTVKKNELLFFKKMLPGKHFLFDLNKLSLKYKSRALKFDATSVESKKMFLHRDEVDEIWKDFLENLTFNKAKFLSEIAELLYKNDLGNEWLQTIYIFLETGNLFFPRHNLHLSKIGNDRNKKRIVIELNPDTSIEDIKMAWAKINKLQGSLYPNFKSTKITKKSFDILKTYLKDLNRKTANPEYKKLKDIWKIAELYPELASKETDRKKAVNLRTIRHRLK